MLCCGFESLLGLLRWDIKANVICFFPAKMRNHQATQSTLSLVDIDNANGIRTSWKVLLFIFLKKLLHMYFFFFFFFLQYSITSLKTIPELCRRCDSQNEDRSGMIPTSVHPSVSRLLFIMYNLATIASWQCSVLFSLVFVQLSGNMTFLFFFFFFQQMLVH